MKEYLEEKDLPSDCASCQYYHMNCADGFSCFKLKGREIHPNFSEGIGCRHKNCPLQSLEKHDKLLIKKVLSDLKEELKKNGKCSIRSIGVIDYYIEMEKLNKIFELFEGDKK